MKLNRKEPIIPRPINHPFYHFHWTDRFEVGDFKWVLMMLMRGYLWEQVRITSHYIPSPLAHLPVVIYSRVFFKSNLTSALRSGRSRIVPNKCKLVPETRDFSQLSPESSLCCAAGFVEEGLRPFRPILLV